MLEHIDQPEAVRHNGRHLVGGQAQHRTFEGYFIGVIPVPGNLFGDAAGIKVLMFHIFYFFIQSFVRYFV